MHANNITTLQTNVPPPLPPMTAFGHPRALIQNQNVPPTHSVFVSGVWISACPRHRQMVAANPERGKPNVRNPVHPYRCDVCNTTQREYAILFRNTFKITQNTTVTDTFSRNNSFTLNVTFYSENSPCFPNPATGCLNVNGDQQGVQLYLDINIS